MSDIEKELSKKKWNEPDWKNEKIDEDSENSCSNGMNNFQLKKDDGGDDDNDKATSTTIDRSDHRADCHTVLMNSYTQTQFIS